MTESSDNIQEYKFAPEISDQLLKYGTLKVLKEGETLLRENAYIRSIPIVVKGSIKVIRSDEEGKELLLYYIKAGESCIMSFMGGMHHETSKVTVIAEEETEIVVIPIEKLPDLLKEFPGWLDYIFRLYHKRFEELLDVVNAIAFKKMDERLLDLVKKKADLAGAKVITVTHEQLANELGTARVVVSRLLKQMEDEGYVKLGRNKISLL